MIAFVPTAVFFLWFCWGVRQDRRQFRNAVLLGLTVLSLSFALLTQVDRLPGSLAVLVYSLVFLVPALAVVVLGGFLVGNGLTMLRKEGRSPGNLLSGLAGLAIFAVLALVVSADYVGSSRAYQSFIVAVVLVTGYVAFLFLCFLAYAFLYGRIRVRGDVDFVVVLGSGLIGGERVPPLLASRLRAGLRIQRQQTERGADAPVLLVSGGQGPDEKLPEAEAMERWLVAEGADPALVRQESRSRTTTENLRFSRRLMEEADARYVCVVVTNNFHAFRAAMTARREGVRGQVIGSPTAAYFWPSATIREFVAVFWENRLVNAALCALLVALAVVVGMRW
ncbi:YdcF family protein [Streptomyces rhizosphaericola]|uniref:YdcF family protein n=1 Tax=Streptomyces rhizosphaericola TaxID=2564098 RepID=A0ABY2PNP9_9ACTN|nr:YdcF family protein [Streptomyces rhizosphaericola]TGZ11985.1 YdcF family protein [Streptomyces rhizosphaericola]